jgi:hypothetical protein
MPASTILACPLAATLAITGIAGAMTARGPGSMPRFHAPDPCPGSMMVAFLDALATLDRQRLRAG